MRITGRKHLVNGLCESPGVSIKYDENYQRRCMLAMDNDFTYCHAYKEGPRTEPKQKRPDWTDSAFARLGSDSDKMTPEQIEIVQRFLDGHFS